MKREALPSALQCASKQLSSLGIKQSRMRLVETKWKREAKEVLDNVRARLRRKSMYGSSRHSQRLKMHIAHKDNCNSRQ